jgi:hypothetical protein
VNGARYDIVSLLGRSVTLVTFHSVDASEIDCGVPRGSVLALFGHVWADLRCPFTG